MESLYLLIPLSLIVLLIAVAIFVWAVNSGQYDDVDREGERILFDDDNRFEKPKPPESDERDTSGEPAEGDVRNG
ncbi:MAG: cbb3-type cytochrome oxidase assembly protein CcoS [Porticoccaceae bacterium]|nr:cbb3-type cytochrome oxidase assembly protein CcoS [Porticoccaceae bacterium]